MNNIQCLYPGKLRKQIRKVDFFHSPHKLFFCCFFLNCKWKLRLPLKEKKFGSRNTWLACLHRFTAEWSDEFSFDITITRRVSTFWRLITGLLPSTTSYRLQHHMLRHYKLQTFTPPPSLPLVCVAEGIFKQSNNSSFTALYWPLGESQMLCL